MKGNANRRMDLSGNDFPLLRRHEVQPGLFLSLLNGRFDKDAATRFERKEGVVEFNFILSGQARASIQRGTGVDHIDVRPGTSLATYLPAVQGDFSIRANQHVQMLGIELELARLEYLFEQQDSRLYKQLQSAPEALFNNSVAISPAQKDAAQQMLSCPLSGSAQTLFLQAKALELIAYQIELFGHLVRRDNTAGAYVPLTPDDEEKIYRARDILKERMADPPGLDELARLCHLNVGKLKKGFRSVFRNTAFGCLHADRMERAYRLLSARRMNVSQVAWEVGYTNVGHFSVAFRKAYGENPKKFQQWVSMQVSPAPEEV